MHEQNEKINKEMKTMKKEPINFYSSFKRQLFKKKKKNQKYLTKKFTKGIQQ